MFTKLCRDLEQQTDSKHEHTHYELINFSCLDNNLIDSVFSNLLTLKRQDSDDMLAEEELIYHLRKITRELDFILDLRFCRFWAFMAKFPLFITFLDEFL